jgi:hypothetical protein
MTHKRIEDLIKELQAVQEKYGNVQIWALKDNGSEYYNLGEIEVEDLNEFEFTRKRALEYSEIPKEDTHLAVISLELFFQYFPI